MSKLVVVRLGRLVWALLTLSCSDVRVVVPQTKAAPMTSKENLARTREILGKACPPDVCERLSQIPVRPKPSGRICILPWKRVMGLEELLAHGDLNVDKRALVMVQLAGLYEDLGVDAGRECCAVSASADLSDEQQVEARRAAVVLAHSRARKLQLCRRLQTQVSKPMTSTCLEGTVSSAPQE